MTCYKLLKTNFFRRTKMAKKTQPIRYAPEPDEPDYEALDHDEEDYEPPPEDNE